MIVQEALVDLPVNIEEPFDYTPQVQQIVHNEEILSIDKPQICIPQVYEQSLEIDEPISLEAEQIEEPLVLAEEHFEDKSES